ncbi:universal stress protein [Dactylosporangium siamense]|uniref:universal stress protein n=1 Tax=Dactylosporangium siamense TaxID=685454 RepID=UPI001941633F|nr:universal stress protein [Dactylosporangium siamense]
MDRPVVVGVDGSTASLGAVRWAADEAARHDRTLRIVHALCWEGPADGQGVVLDAAADARGWQPGLVVETVTVGGPAARVLQEQSRTASLVVIGGRPHDGGLLNSSVGAHLAAFAHCPVLVVNQGERWLTEDRNPADLWPGPPSADRAGPGADPMTALPGSAPVVVGIDGSPSGWRALDFAYDEARSRHVPLLAVHAGHARPHSAVYADLAPWLRRHRDVDARFSGSDEPVLEALTAAASTALLLVVGAHRVGWYEQPRPNPRTQLIVHHAASPVLVTRSV